MKGSRKLDAFRMNEQRKKEQERNTKDWHVEDV